MTFVVPFDGSALSEAALIKASVMATSLANLPTETTNQLPWTAESIDVVAVSVVPEDARYARKKAWIDDDENFDVRLIVDRLRKQIHELAPNAGFEYILVDGSATAGTISARIRKKAKELDVVIVFIGSQNAGHIVSTVTSVARGVAAEDAYDVCLVRHPLPDDIQSTEDLPDKPSKSWF